ncbi:MAG: TolC family protein [Sediminicola sp.]
MKNIELKWVWLLLWSLIGFSQEKKDSLYLGYEEYLEMVKKYHPVVKQARLIGEQGESELLRARGGFDPKIEAEYSSKDYKDTQYYDLFNSTFKVPTWYGIEVKAKFEKNEGEYLNPQNNVPDEGLFAAGISVPIGQGLLINERMAALKKAKAYSMQTRADQQLAVNEVLYDASLAYFDWFTRYRELYLYRDFIENAEIRYNGILQSHRAGDIPAIDTLEANIQIQDRKLSLEQAKLDFFKASLRLGTFLWGGGNTPLEIQERVYPTTDLWEESLTTLEFLTTTEELEAHPKIMSLGYKVDILEFDKKLKANKLLPQIDLEYNFLSSEPDTFSSFVSDNYKFGVNFSVPVFLRKERGELMASKLKLQDAELDLISEKLQLRNKINALQAQYASYQEQATMLNALVDSYSTMLVAEERKLELGESSIFLVNTREQSVIGAKLKQISINQKLLGTRAEIKRVLAIFEG